MKDFKEKLQSTLKEEVSTLDIKTTSESILSSYKQVTPKEEIATPWYKKKGFFYGGSFGLASLVTASVIVGIILGSKPQSEVNPLIPENDAVMNKVCYELFGGVNFVNQENSSPMSLKRRFSKEEITSFDEFYDMSNYFYSYYDLIKGMEEYGNSSSFYEPIKSDKEEYPYCILISNQYKCYFASTLNKDDKEKTKGLLLDGDNSYEIEITTEKEVEEDESEIETSIKLFSSPSSYILIEKEAEMEEGESELSYCLSEYKDNRLLNKIEYELEGYEKSFEVNIHKGIEKGYEYGFGNVLDNILTINYKGEEDWDKVRFDTSSNIFSYMDKNYSAKKIL